MRKSLIAVAALLSTAAVAQAEKLFANIQAACAMSANGEVCALYLPNTGQQAGDLIPGVTPAKPAEVATRLLGPGVRTLAI